MRISVKKNVDHFSVNIKLINELSSIVTEKLTASSVLYPTMPCTMTSA